jgi:rubrerythrin
MILHTASEGISLARKLESDSAGFYEELARRNQQHAESFLAFARENRKNIAQIDRVYFGVITDAIEGSYAFNIESDKYALDISLSTAKSNPEMLKQALLIEEKVIEFYTDAAEQSNSLMADLPRAFEMIAKKRTVRISTIKSLLSIINGV